MSTNPPSEDRQTHIRARALRKEYRSGPEVVVPLNDLDVSIERGSVTALVGPSGSGKSTLLSCLAGIETVDGGSLHIGDTELSASTPAAATAGGPRKWASSFSPLTSSMSSMPAIMCCWVWPVAAPRQRIVSAPMTF